MATDLSKKSVEELLKLKDEIESLIVQKQKEKRTELKKKFKELAEEAGLSIDDILSSVKERKPVGIKYQKESNTWSGRGRQPAWVKDILAKGEKLEDYKVKSS